MKRKKTLQVILKKKLLGKSKVEYASGPGYYALNLAEGCSHGCNFPCYEIKRRVVRFKTIKSYSEWIKPKIVGNTMALLNKELQPKKFKGKVKTVFLCFATDCFMYNQPEIRKLTFEVIKRVNKDNKCSMVLTKGTLPKALADKKKYGVNNKYGITLVFTDEKFRKKFEPGAAPLQARIRSLEYLHDQGLKTWVSIEPFLTPNLAEQDLNKILDSIKFVDRIIFGRLNHNKAATQYLKSDPGYYRNCVKIVRKFCESPRSCRATTAADLSWDQ